MTREFEFGLFDIQLGVGKKSKGTRNEIFGPSPFDPSLSIVITSTKYSQQAYPFLAKQVLAIIVLVVLGYRMYLVNLYSGGVKTIANFQTNFMALDNQN